MYRAVFLLARADHALDARPNMNRTHRTPTSHANNVEDRTRSTALRRSVLARWLAAAPGLAKVPEVTVAFWVAKALSTALGESTSDFLVHRIGPPAAVVIGGLALIAGLPWQLSVDRGNPLDSQHPNSAIAGVVIYVARSGLDVQSKAAVTASSQ